MKKLMMLTYALTAYSIAIVSIAALLLFLIDIPAWKSVNQGKSSFLLGGWHTNICLVIVYFAAHSIMARPKFKRWWTRFTSPSLERATYVLISGLTTLILIWSWQPITNVIWDLSGTAYTSLIHFIFAIGCLIGMASTFTLNHFSFFGIKQAFKTITTKNNNQQALTQKHLYKFIRHPISLGWIIIFWATPTMTAGHFLLASLSTLYIIIVTPIEEADLISEMGEQYIEYQKKVGKFIPVMDKRK